LSTQKLLYFLVIVDNNFNVLNYKVKEPTATTNTSATVTLSLNYSSNRL